MYGGAIYWKSDGCRVSDCTFINNTALYGGALYWRGNSGDVSRCVFLGNSADEGDAIDVGTFYHLNVNYCWFGNTATDYTSQPPIEGNFGCNYWLFLNATADPDIISVSHTSDITFKLCLYDSSSGKISEYDNSPFRDLNLTIKATNGISNNTAKLGETIKFNATERGTGSITATIENADYSIYLNIKFNSDLSFNSQSYDYSDNAIIALDYNASATGTVNITLKGKNGNNYTFTNLALNATIMLPEAINADEYDVNVTYSGDYDFMNATSAGKLTINKVNSTLTVNNITFDYNDEGSCEVLYTGATGIEAKVGGHDEAIVYQTGNIITVSNLDAGNHTLIVTTIADMNHNSVNKTANITVNKARTEIIIENATLNVKVLNFTSAGATLTPAEAGNLTYNSSNSSVAMVEGGVIMPLGKGQAIITVSFNGTDNYEAAESKNITIAVSLNDASVIVDTATLNLNVGQTYAINATTNPSILKLFNITYASSDDSVVTVDKNGTITAIGGGTAVITVGVGDDMIFAKNSTEICVTVNKLKTQIISSAITATYNANKNLVITLKDDNANALSGLSIIVNLNGAKTYTTNKNGQVIINVANLVPKSYTAKITFAGNSKYISSSADVKITVKKAKAKIVAKKKTFKKAKKIKKYTIKLKSRKTAIKKVKVTLKIKGKKTIKAKTNKKGKATFKIKKLTKKGKYKVVIKFKGNAYYKAATKMIKITIK